MRFELIRHKTHASETCLSTNSSMLAFLTSLINTFLLFFIKFHEILFTIISFLIVFFSCVLNYNKKHKLDKYSITFMLFIISLIIFKYIFFTFLKSTQLVVKVFRIFFRTIIYAISLLIHSTHVSSTIVMFSASTRFWLFLVCYYTFCC